MEISTTKYQFAHGKKPRGKGLWFFAYLGQTDSKVWVRTIQFNGEYSAAKKALRAEMKASGAYFGEVLS